jgi:Tfp pilus assembly protein PilF
MRGVLRLEAREHDGPTRWRWVLTDDVSGAFIADHEVQLDESSWQYEAFIDLQHYLSWHAAPDRYAQEEARIVAGVGEWIGSEVFGPVAEALADKAKRAPVTVNVAVPAGKEALLFQPLELAHVHGRPLTVQDVTLVMQIVGQDFAEGTAPVGDRLRVLGLFSLPEGGQPLNLRRERHALVRLINRIVAHGKAAEVRVLQYGVTRERLRNVLEEAEGWDVVHISGHGTPGELLLETAAGTLDKVTARELAALLEPARERVKLVTVCACWSAAVTVAQQRRRLGLPIIKGHSPQWIGGDSSSPGNFATELTDRLGCAVLAMRYPVADDFAIELSAKLYDLLAEKGQPLARALGMTVKELTSGNRFPALSAATPALFGVTAAEVTLAAPKRSGPPSYATGELKMAGFPPQPERFVGRTRVMARSSEALAEESGVPGVLLDGMPGGGKTACALELAYTHEHAFDRLVWYKAPDEGMEISGALTDFALALEQYLEDFQMVHLVSDVGKLAGFRPRFAELMERNRILIVIDNAESLLTESGQWRDERWGKVIGALTGHTGLGRVIITSRRVPAGTPGLHMEAVDALSADEALLLARELPHLKNLINGETSGMETEVARTLALGILNIACGHPKLLELADGQAARPQQLVDLVAVGGQVWREHGGLPDGFFTSGEAPANSGDYRLVLEAWTIAVADTLSPDHRDLFWFLCCLEEPDRERFVIDTIWPHLWEHLGHHDQPPVLDEGLAAIAAHTLTSIQPGTNDKNESYAIHPGIGAAGRGQAGKAFRDAVDSRAAAHWSSVYDDASGKNRVHDLRTEVMVRAGLSAVPYLMRQQQWLKAGVMLDNAFREDPSRGNAAALLSAIEQITSREPSMACTLAGILGTFDPAAAEAQLREFLDYTSARGIDGGAAIAAVKLVNLCLASGRLAEALSLAGQVVDYERRAGAGPWTQLLAEAQRLQVLNAMGRASQVLTEVQRLRQRMDSLPATPDTNDTADRMWHAREALYDTGRDAAQSLGRWQDALDLNANVIASMRERHATAANIAHARYNDYGPLLKLGRANDALEMLLDCRKAFSNARDTAMLSAVLTALANVEDQRGHGDAAIRLELDALRYAYLAGRVAGILIGYHNLGSYLANHAGTPASALSSHLAAALIHALTGADGSGDSIREAARDLRVSGTAADPPTDIADLCRKIGDIPGTDPVTLIQQLSPDPETAERMLRDLITQARELAEKAAMAANDLGVLLIEQGDAEGARAAYQQAIDSGSPLAAPSAARNLGSLLSKLGDSGGARAAYQQAIDSRHPDESPWAALNLGDLHGAGGDVDAARSAYQQAIDSEHPDHAPRAAFNLGCLLAEHQDINGACAAYQYAVASGHPDDGPSAALNLGGLLKDLGHTGDARAAYHQAINSGHVDASPMAAFNLGNLLADEGDAGGARAASPQAIDSGHAVEAIPAAVALGSLLADLGDLDGARAAYQQAIESAHAEQAPKAAIALGNLLARHGDPDGARAAYEHALQVASPDLAPLAALNFGLLLADQHDVDGARALLQQAIDSGRDDIVPRAAYSLGMLLSDPFALRNDAAGARAAYQQAIESGDADISPKAALNLGILLSRHDMDGARAAYQQAISLGHLSAGPMAAFGLGIMLAHHGRKDEARAAYQLAIDSGHPNYAALAAYQLREFGT